MKQLWLFLAIAAVAAAQPSFTESERPVLPKVFHGIGIDQNLNAQVPLQASFRDESGQPVELGQYLGRRPAILALVYYQCTMLCNQILNGLVTALRPLSLKPGRDFDVIAISINPKEGPDLAAAKRATYVKLYSKRARADGWHFLTGTEENIRAVADAVGFHYRYDAKNDIFLHASGIMMLTPEGKAARYFYGVEYQPKDMKLGLIEASHNRIGSPVDQILLFCYHYDPNTAKYTGTVLNLLRFSAAGFLALFGVVIGFWWRRDMRRQRRFAVEARRT